MTRMVTIGVFGFTEEGFFSALTRAGVDTFCDVRWRRGVRGREYAFANRARLEHRLGGLGIRYLHFRDLAPPPALRERQGVEDRANKVAKRQRTELGQAFREAYRGQCLAGFNAGEFLRRLGGQARVAALFCVEREPAACHRSLLAEELTRQLGIEIAHLKPD
ncbi:DUF488 domain-containing protein [bacterium]|nr:DUF488 domain-containing protein [bacterium]